MTYIYEWNNKKYYGQECEILREYDTVRKYRWLVKFKDGETLRTNHIRKVRLPPSMARHFTPWELQKINNFNKENKMKEKNIWGYPCEYELYNSSLVIIRYSWKYYRYSFFGDVEEWIDKFTPVITENINASVEKEVEEIMNGFDKNFNITIGKLKAINLPNTKELLLAKVMERTSENVKNLAEMFDEPRIKSSIKNIFSILNK